MFNNAANIRINPNKDTIEGPVEKSKRYEKASPPIETIPPVNQAMKRRFLKLWVKMAEKVAGIIRKEKVKSTPAISIV